MSVVAALQGLRELALQSLELVGGGAGAVEGSGGGSDVHVEGDPDAGVAGEAGDVGGVHVPGEQGGGAEDVAQAVPGPGGVPGRGGAPAGGMVGGGQDAGGAGWGRPARGAGGGGQ